MPKDFFRKLCSVEDKDKLVFDKLFSYRFRFERDLKNYLDRSSELIISNRFIRFIQGFFEGGCSVCGKSLARDDFTDTEAVLTPDVVFGCVGFYGFKVDFLDCDEVFLVEVLDKDKSSVSNFIYGEDFLVFCSEDCRDIALSLGSF